MAIVFDGRRFADKKERELKKEVSKLRKNGITPKLVSILIGDNPASVLYTSLKQKAAQRIGAKAQVISLSLRTSPNKIKKMIEQCNNNPTVHGIMVQLPLPKNLKSQTQEILNTIAPQKDVDGLRTDSNFVPATVEAVLQIIKQAPLKDSPCKVVVVGAEGMVGRALVRELRIMNYELREADINTKDLESLTKTADILVSATGKPGIIKSDMVKEGTVVIDVGSPKGDIDFNEIAKRASFITPVPGGVGPVTIVSLLENLLIATRNSIW
jgi:methylenetetrahydrofolate dehydrogenase (NADP+)/methenyltetrahydrofolate cyclohydrolase